MTRAREDGFVLVATLWLLAALAALASAYSIYAVRTAPNAALPEQRLRAEAALRAGVELGALRQLSWPKPARPDYGAFSAEIGDVPLEVAFRSESARVDLNAAPRDVLAGLFVQLGAPAASAGFLADRIVAWRSRPKDDERQRETILYEKAGLAYRPPGAPFDNALELALLPTMTPSLLQRTLDYVTIFGADKIDPFVADPLVLAALPGANAATIKSFAAARKGPRPDSAGLARMAGPLKDFVGADPNEHVRLEIAAMLGGRRISAEVVIKINDAGLSPYEIVSWRDDF